ncbi:TPA: hypothetical protein SMT61_003550 [Proteus mirabilis]|uniref:hypothetical protein n=1 Tax=Proteus mirabilis TaxID=584 RepID=UPI0029E37E98|nr:hypothetical protein [Proteus mirabilis]HEK1205909.1 hypothetical protein [Proteus mirabilis]HEK2780542.1 hypothetical protein [Proteus mirabilis]
MNRFIIALSVLLSLSFVASSNSDFKNVIGWNNEGNKIYCEVDAKRNKSHVRAASITPSDWIVSDPYIVDGSLISCEFDKKIKQWIFTNHDQKAVSIPYVIPKEK